MKLARTAIAGILSLLAATSAVAQQFPTVPAQSVIGRLGVPGDSGPSSAIPISTLLNTRPLAAGQIIVGNNIGLQANVALSGDCTMSSLGVITCTKTNGSLFGSMATQNSGSVAITGGTITGLPTPTNASDAATKSYVDNVKNCTAANSANFVGDGTTDNTAAFTTWWSGLSSSGGCLEFGVGKYRFNSAISKTMAAGRQTVTIRGLASDLSILYWPTGGGMTITQGSSLNSIGVSDLTFSTGAVNTGVGLKLDSNNIALGVAQLSNITRVAFRGDDFTDISANTDYWAVGLQIKGWSSVNLTGITTYGLLGAPATAGGGTGLQIAGYGSSAQAVVINIYGSTFSWHNVAAELDSFWEGVTFNQCNFQGETGSAGIFVPSAQTNAGPLLTLNGNQFNTAGVQIDLLTGVPQVIMSNNSITTIGNSSVGAALGTGANAIVTGNLFNLASGTTTTGLSMNGNTGTVVGNVFVGLNTAILLAGSSSNVTVSQNAFSGVTTTVTNSGTGNSVGALHN